MSQQQKLEVFREGVREFISSPKGAKDILEFSIVCLKAYSPGSGIQVHQAEKIINELIAEREK